MRTDPLPHQVRELVADAFRQLTSPFLNPSDIDETILIDEGRYAGRSYRVEGYMAMWLVDIGIIQFYDTDGNMVHTINLFRELKPQRMAA